MTTPVFWTEEDDDHFWFSHHCTTATGTAYTDTSRMPHSGGTWHIVSNPNEPLSVVPSIHCRSDKGGCGLHGWITDGKWVPA